MTDFRVGDRVQTPFGWNYVVLCVDDGEAWLRESGGWTAICRVENLTLIPDTVTIEVSREDANELADWKGTETLEWPLGERVAKAARAALEADRD